MNYNDVRRGTGLAQRLEPNLRVIEAVGQRAQTVVDHPGWQLYLDHLEAMVTNLTKEKDATVSRMVELDALGDALGALKLRVRDLEGQIRGLKQAMDLIPALVERGKDAIREFDSISR